MSTENDLIFEELTFLPICLKPICSKHSNMPHKFCICSCSVLPVTIMSSSRLCVLGMSWRICSIIHCQIAGADAIPNTDLCYQNNPLCVLMVRILPVSLSTTIWSGSLLAAGLTWRNAFLPKDSQRYLLCMARGTARVLTWGHPCALSIS